ncbi:MAG TPA: hypothetical protein PK096_01705 [Candidatus Saccharibacteria bacterium]|nr:hypothetical protein [Candidatus Saccharibacteria bacterium]HRK94061.1 hypothetical protein [Candidatus Saccharibacteria bacterium]
MAEENYDVESGNSDDVSVLRVLLHTLHGISPVSTTDFVTVPAEGESDVSFETTS